MAEPTILELVDAGTYNASRVGARFTEAAPALEEFTIQVGNFQEQAGLEVDWKFGPQTEGRAWQEVQIYRQNPNQGGFGQWFDSILTWPQDQPAGGGGNGTTGGGGGAATGNGGNGTTGGGGGGGGGGDVPDAPVDPPQPAPAATTKKKRNWLAIGAFGLGGLLLVGLAVTPADPKPKKKKAKKKKRRGR